MHPFNYKKTYIGSGDASWKQKYYIRCYAAFFTLSNLKVYRKKPFIQKLLTDKNDPSHADSGGSRSVENPCDFSLAVQN